MQLQKRQRQNKLPLGARVFGGWQVRGVQRPAYPLETKGPVAPGTMSLKDKRGSQSNLRPSYSWVQKCLNPSIISGKDMQTENEATANKDKKVQDNKSRLAEIKDVLVRNKITRGVTPEKLRTILEELGPTYIKIGQIMSLHSDILPARYCDELLKLNSSVAPMPFETVEEVINRSYRQDWHEVFSSIDPKPLGSASIAQVHKAVLLTGEDVVVKVQRKGIYDIMARDISLLHRLVHLMPPVGDLKNLVDLNMVLDELWSVAQEEMDFLKEAANMEEFARNNKGIVYVSCPKLYHEFTTSRVLVMEYIEGTAINDKETLLDGGYDLHEIGTKYVNNFIKQVMDDGFFHADPHPGNVKVSGGQIVWIDMGMMGRLSEKDRKVMVKGVQGIALHDVTMVENAVLEIGEFRGRPDRARLWEDLRKFLDDYGAASMGGIDIAEVLADLMEIMKENGISLPHGVTMLCRGLAHVEGVLAEISPDINMFQIAVTRFSEDYLHQLDLKKELGKGGRTLYRAVKKGAEIPALTTDTLNEFLHGRAKVNIIVSAQDEFTVVAYALVRNLVIGVCIAALLMSSAIICTTDMQPKVMGIPVLGAAGFIFALGVSMFLVLRNIYYRYRKPKKDRKGFRFWR